MILTIKKCKPRLLGTDGWGLYFNKNGDSPLDNLCTGNFLLMGSIHMKTIQRSTFGSEVIILVNQIKADIPFISSVLLSARVVPGLVGIPTVPLQGSPECLCNFSFGGEVLRNLWTQGNNSQRLTSELKRCWITCTGGTLAYAKVSLDANCNRWDKWRAFQITAVCFYIRKWDLMLSS